MLLAADQEGPEAVAVSSLCYALLESLIHGGAKSGSSESETQRKPPKSKAAELEWTSDNPMVRVSTLTLTDPQQQAFKDMRFIADCELEPVELQDLVVSRKIAVALVILTSKSFQVFRSCCA